MNTDSKRRDQILGLKPKNYSCGIARFDKLLPETLALLVNEGFALPEDTQNEAPSLGEILEFILYRPEITCHGYAISIARGDYRISIEGLEYIGTDPILREEMLVFCRLADELDVDPQLIHAWWD